jgi:hypothetical protein
MHARTAFAAGALALGLALGSLFSVHADDKPPATAAAYTDPAYGYTLEPPRFPAGKDGDAGVRVMMYSVPEGGFAANVNVLVAHRRITRADLRAETLRDLGQMNWKVVSTKELMVSGREAIVFEYEGAMPGQAQMLRFMGLSVVDDDRLFTITGTALAKSFASVEKEMRASIESFRLPERK